MVLNRRHLLAKLLTTVIAPLGLTMLNGWSMAFTQAGSPMQARAMTLAGSLRGVQAQFDEGWSPAVLEAAQAAGLEPTFVRFNFIRRPSTEPKPGQYDFSEYAPALEKMRRLGIRHTM